MKINSYSDLTVWQKSIQLVEMIYVITKDFPKDELYALTNQIRRAAVSIPSNIAEGQQRNSTEQFCYFLSIAQGSKAEVETQVIIAKRLNYITENKEKELLKQLEEISKMLVALKKRLSQK